MNKEAINNIFVFNNDNFDTLTDDKKFNTDDKVKIINGLNKNKIGVIFRVDYGDFGYSYRHYQYIVRFGDDVSNYIYVPYKYNQLENIKKEIKNG